MKFFNKKVNVSTILVCLFIYITVYFIIYNTVYFIFNCFDFNSFLVTSHISGFAAGLIFSSFFPNKKK